jgi:hypothetical protein
MSKHVTFGIGAFVAVITGVATFAGWVLYEYNRHVLKRRGWRR